MYFLTHVSSATETFTREGLNELMSVCVTNNRRDSMGNYVPIPRATAAVIFKQAL